MHRGERLTVVKVRVRHPAVEHRVRVQDLRRWLVSHGRAPAECAVKRKLSDMAQGEGRER